jgi:signal transduction histidine kinase/CheY-like chemotaxis protein
MIDRLKKPPNRPEESLAEFGYLSRFLLLLGLFLVIGAGFHWANHLSGRKQAKIAMEASLKNVSEDYAAVLRNFEMISGYIYHELMSIPEVPALVARIDAADTPEDAQTVRDALHDAAYELHQRARRVGLKQLHFHTKESASMLRMHRPEKYGDSLVGVRRTVEIANQEKVHVSGFEEGRIFNGYRYVYPVFHEGAHVGSVEISFSSSQLLKQLFETNKGRRYAFLLQRDITEDSVFEDEQWNYVNSVFGGDVVEESNDYVRPFIERAGKDWGESEASLALEEAYRRASGAPDQAVTFPFRHAETDYKFIYLPIYNIEGDRIAALVCIEPGDTLEVIYAYTRRNHLIGLLVGAIVLFLGIWLFYRWQRESKRSHLFAERITRIAENLPGVVYQLRFWPKSGKSCFPYVSAGFREFMGVGAEAVREDASAFFDLILPEDRDVFMASLLESARTMERWSCEFRLLREGERLRWLEGNSTPKSLDDGSVVWYGFFQNVTARKEYERLLQEARENAERAEKAKTRFLSTMSHEIRTPMNAIIGLSDLLSGTELNEEQSEFVHTIVDSGNALLNLISDILDYSKIEAERMVILEEEFDLVEMFDKVSRIGNTLAVGKGRHFLAERIGEIPARCIGDEGRITQILLNLVSNAVKYSEDGGEVEFYLRLIEMEADCASLQFEVVDHGVGISEEQKARLFKPFAQVEDGTRPHEEGTGLGLAISLRLSELMGGKLSCTSEPREGSRFYFMLRLETAASKSLKNEIAGAPFPVNKHNGKAGSGDAMNVLVVDDDPVNVRVVGLMLKKLGLKADTAENGQAALSACLNKDYDLVLMDLQMPVMDGHKATAAIFGQLPPERHPSIVALTANASEEQQKTSLDLGMEAFLTKPLKLDRLKSVVDSVLEKKV